MLVVGYGYYTHLSNNYSFEYTAHPSKNLIEHDYYLDQRFRVYAYLTHTS